MDYFIKVIERGRQTFIEVGNALREIRDGKGYRHKYGTFEEYCEQRWGFSARHGRNIINASSVAQLSSQKGKSISQTQAQHIASLAPEQQITFAESHDIASMTSRDVDKAVNYHNLIVANCDKRELLESLPKSLVDEIARPSAPTDLKQAVFDGEITTNKEKQNQR